MKRFVHAVAKLGWSNGADAKQVGASGGLPVSRQNQGLPCLGRFRSHWVGAQSHTGRSHPVPRCP